MKPEAKHKVGELVAFPMRTPRGARTITGTVSAVDRDTYDIRYEHEGMQMRVIVLHEVVDTHSSESGVTRVC